METYKTNISEFYIKLNKRENIYQLVEEIKELSDEQRVLKNQRKTVNLIGERTMEPWKAVYKHQQNRKRLSRLLAAYDVLRGFKPVVPKKWKDDEKFYIDTVVQETVDEFSKQWMPDHKDEYRKMIAARHEKIMKMINGGTDF